MNKLKYVIPETVLKYLYESLIKPYFLYGIEVWYSSTNFNKEKLFKIQKYSVRTIRNLDINSHTSLHFQKAFYSKIGGYFSLPGILEII